MNTPIDFDAHARTWDDDPERRARAHAVADAIRNKIPLSADLCGLEYGCGTGLLSFALRPSLGEMTLADSSDGMLTVLNEKIAAANATNMHPIKLDLSTDPIPDDRYDIIFTMLTMHHVPDIEKILGDFFILLHSPGYLCIVDLDAEDGSFHGAGFTGHKGFDRRDLGRRVEYAGFRNVSFSTVFNITKHDTSSLQQFSVFLMVAEKLSV